MAISAGRFGYGSGINLSPGLPLFVAIARFHVLGSEYRKELLNARSPLQLPKFRRIRFAYAGFRLVQLLGKVLRGLLVKEMFVLAFKICCHVAFPLSEDLVVSRFSDLKAS